MSGWVNKTLPQLADFINGYGFKPEDWGKEGLPIIRIEQLKNKNSICDFYAGTLPTNNVIEDGDLLFSWSASLFLKIWDGGQAALNQHLFKVVNREQVNRLFLKYLIEHNLPELLKSAHGLTMQHITRKDLNKFRVNVPISETEQAQIAVVLSQVDRVIEQTEALIAKQERIKAGLLHDLLTKGLDQTGNIRSEETHEFKDSPLGRVPAEWEVVPLDRVCHQITSGSRGWARFHAVEGAKFIRIGNLTRRHINLRWEETQYVRLPRTSEGKRTSLQSGDLLISITADLGIIGVVPEGIGEAYVNQHIALVRLDKHKVNPWFLGNFLTGSAIQKHFANINDSGAKAGLNLPTVAAIPVVLPKREKQDAIAAALGTADTLIVREQQKLVKLQKLKIGLMQDLLTERKSVAPLLDTKVNTA